jgi:hypothetical protein
VRGGARAEALGGLCLLGLLALLSGDPAESAGATAMIQFATDLVQSLAILALTVAFIVYVCGVARLRK